MHPLVLCAGMIIGTFLLCPAWQVLAVGVVAIVALSVLLP